MLSKVLDLGHGGSHGLVTLAPVLAVHGRPDNLQVLGEVWLGIDRARGGHGALHQVRVFQSEDSLDKELKNWKHGTTMSSSVMWW